MCTLLGAFPGAMPVLIGYVAAAGELNSPAWLFYAILFLWQFPHFMAIAWMYREDYARAGYAVLLKGREKARFMGWQSVLPSLALIPTAVASLILQHANQVLVVATLLLSLSFLSSPQDLRVFVRTALLASCFWSRLFTFPCYSCFTC
jgi:protoheme IX farnesyltransferase